MGRRGLSKRAGYRRRAGRADGLTVPVIAIIDGPGYRRSYGETTKRAAEGSVFSLPMLPQGQMGLGVTRSELANLDVVG